MERPKVVADMSASVNVIRHVGAWMRDANLQNYSEWWDPDNVSEDMLSPYASPGEFFIIELHGQTAATAIIQNEQSLQDWSSIDGDSEPPRATYIHYAAVERHFAGKGLVAILVQKADELAIKQGSSVIRLDTDADEPKLCGLYEGLGFVRAGTEKEGDRNTAFYEKTVT